MPDKCISDPARNAIIAAIGRLETCPQISQPVIQRTKYGKAIFEDREYKSLNFLAEHFPGGIYRETKEKEGPLKATGGQFKVSTDVFEKPLFPDGTPFSHIYTVTREKRKGLPVVVVTNERKNPDYVPPQPAEKPTSKRTTKKA